ncbi:hypothetical protein JW949_01995 [Candidatus Woesearchaeota archaeon]|nr:hypothetical protein [Candidatus Woesearchaeota archaeon]
MAWKKVIDTKELIVFEKKFKKHKLKIEARLNNNKKWEVYKSSLHHNSSSLISQDVLNSRQDVLNLIKKKNTLSKKIRTKFNLNLRRIYKEEYFEKWSFTIDDDQKENVLFLRFGEEIAVDVVLHETFKRIENLILKKISNTLGFRDLNDSFEYNVYYFSSCSTINKKDQKPHAEIVFGKIEFGFRED